MNIHQVLEYGYIVASDEDYDLLITVNGAYFNIWSGDMAGNYENTDCRATDYDNGLYGKDIAAVADKAEAILEEILQEGSEEVDDEE